MRASVQEVVIGNIIVFIFSCSTASTSTVQTITYNDWSTRNGVIDHEVTVLVTPNTLVRITNNYKLLCDIHDNKIRGRVYEILLSECSSMVLTLYWARAL